MLEQKDCEYRIEEIDINDTDVLEDAFAPVFGIWCKGCSSSSAWGIVCG